jgi:predicted Zn-dependent protease
MKINVDVDISPEELRRFMGLPDVQGFQQQMLEQFSNNLANSQEQQEEFVRNLFTSSIAPWQNFFAFMSGANTSGEK